MASEDVKPTLREANQARQIEWDAGNQITLAYRGNEFAGEAGEVCNVIKKLERERIGIAGSRDTIDHLAEELADAVICADLIAMAAGVDLDAAVEAKFNATSEKVGLATRYLRAAQPVASAAPAYWIFTSPETGVEYGMHDEAHAARFRAQNPTWPETHLFDQPAAAAPADRDARAKVLANWLGYAWEGLRDGSCEDRGFPVWTRGQFGLSFQGGQEDLRRLVDAIAALQQESPRTIVKPLEWEPANSDGTKSYSSVSERLIDEKAITPFGAYFIEHDEGDDSYWLLNKLLGKEIAGPFADISDARAAGDAHHERRILSALAHPLHQPAPEAAHHDDLAIDHFAKAMKAKMKWERDQRGRRGWNDRAVCSTEYLSRLLWGHVKKGDPVDVANLAMMLSERGERIAPAPEPQAPVPGIRVPFPALRICPERDALCPHGGNCSFAIDAHHCNIEASRAALTAANERSR